MSDSISVLVVDDFSTMRRIIKKHLSGLGLTNIVEAENGLKAWNIIQDQNIDLVVCDWNMPEMTGMELLKKVRTSESLKHIPFIMVTAESKTKITIEHGEEKLTDYIAKPFKAKDLEEKIKSMLQV
ncbi:Chemotaxis protein [Desulfonema limicola]|uniref:Chemotaxis protein n=1 Tax=Desulfonema limicola TaxID=45656 RepID=A0A975GHQ8_9BACT|nr:response regulator [Desulfonema limicola]QTA81687.1 Chemotaxis protein [Desulfonema limicola]